MDARLPGAYRSERPTICTIMMSLSHSYAIQTWPQRFSSKPSKSIRLT